MFWGLRGRWSVWLSVMRRKVGCEDEQRMARATPKGQTRSFANRLLCSVQTRSCFFSNSDERHFLGKVTSGWRFGYGKMSGFDGGRRARSLLF